MRTAHRSHRTHKVFIGGGNVHGELEHSVRNFGIHGEVERTFSRNGNRRADIISAGAYKPDAAVANRGVRVISVAILLARDLRSELYVGHETVDFNAYGGRSALVNLLHKGDYVHRTRLDSGDRCGHFLGLVLDASLESDGHGALIRPYGKVAHVAVIIRLSIVVSQFVVQWRASRHLDRGVAISCNHSKEVIVISHGNRTLEQGAGDGAKRSRLTGSYGERKRCPIDRSREFGIRDL